MGCYSATRLLAIGYRLFGGELQASRRGLFRNDGYCPREDSLRQEPAIGTPDVAGNTGKNRPAEARDVDIIQPGVPSTKTGDIADTCISNLFPPQPPSG